MMKKINFLLFTIFFLACNEVPVKNLERSLTMQVQELREKSPPVQLDILWVVDDSPSMCQEQENLAKSFHIFTDILKKYATIDAQIAVTTTNVCPPDKKGVRGKFVYQPAATFPPACYVTEVFNCLEDKQCNDAFPGQTWYCDHPPAKDIFSCDKIEDNKDNKVIVINSYCTYRCNKENVAECPYLFGYPDKCRKICEQSKDCYKSCTELFSEEAQKCNNVCNPNHSCVETCMDFFSEKQTCEKVCSSQSCFSECEGNFTPILIDPDTNKPKPQNFGESFPCDVICKAKNEYSCKDQCILNFGEPRYRCIWPGGSEINSGCLMPPLTKFCPLKGPKVLNNDVVNIYYELYKKGEWKGDPKWQALGEKELKEKIFEYLFLCMATVGAEQQVCGTQEQPLLAAWMALDPEGENKAQSKNFLRKDAYLLIIFIGDEDDCSTVDKIKAEDYSRCPCLKTTEEGGPLYPVSYFVNKFKTLKKDPAMVLVATISGEVIPDSSTTPLPYNLKKDYKLLQDAINSEKNEEKKKELEFQLESLLSPWKNQVIERYFECKCDKKKPLYSPGTYICLSKQGLSDYGKRYAELVHAFSAKKATDLAFGVSANICSDRGFDEAMEKIAKTVLPIISHICLPRPIVEQEWIQVYIIKANNEKILQIKEKDYDLIQSLRCKNFKPNAVQFKYPLDLTDRVEILYKADPLWIEETLSQ